MLGLRGEPGLVLRAILFWAALHAGTECHALPPSRRVAPPTDYPATAKPDQAEGARILAEFRRMGVVGNYYFEFNLRILPRHGAESSQPGRLWGGRNTDGPVARIEIGEATGSDRRLLVQNGPAGRVWSWEPGTARVQLLGAADLLQPVAPGVEVTPFDLQMPFLYWSDFVFEGVRKHRGRPAHVFVMSAPAEMAAHATGPTAVRIFLDTQFGALVQAEYLGRGKGPMKTLSVLDIKKIDDQWVVKSIDVRDESSRNKTRFEITGAALGLDFPGTVFAPATLPEAVRPPAGTARFAP